MTLNIQKCLFFIHVFLFMWFCRVVDLVVFHFRFHEARRVLYTCVSVFEDTFMKVSEIINVTNLALTKCKEFNVTGLELL